MSDALEFRDLLSRMRQGDVTATEIFTERYGPFIRAAVRRKLHDRLRTRFDSLDFVQDVWASFLSMPAGQDSFASPEALVAFLTRVAQNKVVDAVRQRLMTQKQNAQRETELKHPVTGKRLMLEEIPAAQGTPSQWAMASEEWERLLEQFRPGHRLILDRLREGHSPEEIARMANLSLSTVQRVIRRLKELSGL